MIASIHGEIQAITEDSLIIKVGGVGLKVFVPAPLRASSQVGNTIFLFTYLVVREDLLSLYGFEQTEEEHFFTLLLGVSGVGPRTALAIISSMTTDAMRRAVLSEQPDLFARVPGVGKKTAQKILLGLQGKIKGGLGDLGQPMMDVDSEVVDALIGLGYSVVEAQAAVQSIPRNASEGVEDRLRLALQYFSN